jgi:aminocarboxymuconate-semialdehyde decarboxylase
LFGSDFPYLRRDLAEGCVGEIAQSSELSEAERDAVLGGNALTLFPRLIRIRDRARLA